MSTMLDEILAMVCAVEAQHELDRRPDDEPFDPAVLGDWIRRYTCDLLPTMSLYVEPEWEDERMGLAFGSVTLSRSAYQRALAMWTGGGERGVEPLRPDHDQRHGE